MKFFAFEYSSGRYTTLGTPHPATGNYSIAGTLHVFKSKEEREKWVDAGVTTSGIRGNCREVVTKNKARILHLGMRVEQYTEYLDGIS